MVQGKVAVQFTFHNFSQGIESSGNIPSLNRKFSRSGYFRLQIGDLDKIS
jgi:hypothetical protein